MNPVIIAVKQGTMLGPGSVPVAILNITWTFGTFGPFTLQSNWEELNSGVARQRIQAQASALSLLPTS